MDAQKFKLKLEVRPTIRSRSPRELLIFGLDDTLIDTSLYWLARAAFARAVAAKTGKPEDPVVSLCEARETQKKGAYEVSPGDGSVTIQDTWEAFRKECDIPPQNSDNESCLLMARSLRSKFPTAIPGAEDLLKWAQPRFTLALLTSGESEIQMQKLEASKFGTFFKTVKIVPSKGKEDFLALFSEMGFSPRNSWVFGNSIHFDIDPGLAAGANCIHFTSSHRRRNGAREEIEEPAEPIFRIRELSDARAILAKTWPSVAA